MDLYSDICAHPSVLNEIKRLSDNGYIEFAAKLLHMIKTLRYNSDRKVSSQIDVKAFTELSKKHYPLIDHKIMSAKLVIQDTVWKRWEKGYRNIFFYDNDINNCIHLWLGQRPYDTIDWDSIKAIIVNRYFDFKTSVKDMYLHEYVPIWKKPE